MTNIEDLERRIKTIEDRNARVETDKAWETSWTRRLSIGLLTYGVIVIYLILIDNDKPFINAAVPAAGFVLSTPVLRQVRNIWESRK